MYRLLVLCLLLPLLAPAQTQPDCEKMLRDGDALMARRDPPLEEALRCYLNALNCNSQLAGVVGPKVQGVFEAIKAQKEREQRATRQAKGEAEHARKEQEKAAVNEKKAKEATISAVREKEKADSLYRRADRSARANRLAALALNKVKADYTLSWHLAYMAYQTSYDSVQAGGTEPGVSGIMDGIFSDSDQWLYKIFKGPTSSIQGAVFSPDGNYILTYSSDSTARLWDKNGLLLKTLQGHASRVKGAVFSPDVNYILTCSEDHTARLWDKNG
ncbi:MAG: hypothetical protein ABIQ93_13240, partial [Saprospiraceae bacterium]